MKKDGPQCSHAIYTLKDFEPNNSRIQLYRVNLPHDHHEHANLVVLPEEIKKFIIDQAKMNPVATAKTILHRCQEKFGIKSPTRKQIEYLHYSCKKENIRIGDNNNDRIGTIC